MATKVYSLYEKLKILKQNINYLSEEDLADCLSIDDEVVARVAAMYIDQNTNWINSVDGYLRLDRPEQSNAVMHVIAYNRIPYSVNLAPFSLNVLQEVINQSSKKTKIDIKNVVLKLEKHAALLSKHLVENNVLTPQLTQMLLKKLKCPIDPGWCSIGGIWHLVNWLFLALEQKSVSCKRISFK